jgi:O-antigen ligase
MNPTTYGSETTTSPVNRGANLREILLTAALLLAALTDCVRRLSLGPVTALAGVTIVACVGSALLLVFSSRIPKRLVVIALMYLAFMGWGSYSLVVNMGSSELSFQLSIQNLLTYGAFVGLLLLSACETIENPYPSWYIRHGFMVAAGIAAGLYAFSILVNGPGSGLIMSARAFSAFVVVMLPFCLAAWRYKVPHGRTIAIAMTICVALSFSRTATVIALILYPLSRFSPHKPEGWFRLVGWIMGIALVAYLSFTYVQPIRDRFTEKGDSGSIAGVSVNTAGRDRMWEAVQISTTKSPIVGQGPGSVAIPVGLVNQTAGGHPHNDYLRLSHDFGYVGCGLWVGGLLMLITVTFRNWLWADTYDRNMAHYHLGAMLGILGMMQLMLTDNIVVYVFAMGPLGILTGSSISIGALRRRQYERAKMFKSS